MLCTDWIVPLVFANTLKSFGNRERADYAYQTFLRAHLYYIGVKHSKLPQCIRLSKRHKILSQAMMNEERLKLTTFLFRNGDSVFRVTTGKIDDKMTSPTSPQAMVSVLFQILRNQRKVCRKAGNRCGPLIWAHGCGKHSVGAERSGRLNSISQ